MKQKNTWMTPGAPWELHLLSLVFVLVAAVVPLYVNHLATPFANRTLLDEALHPHVVRLPPFIHPSDAFWVVTLALLFTATLLASRFRADRNSTPIPAILAPLFFAFLAYYRLYSASLGDIRAAAIVTSRSQLVVWGLASMAVVFLVARLRLARFALGFRDIKWDLATNARHDPTFFALALRILPLIYEPRTYRACERGLLIEGWFYMLVIPFDMVQSISEASQPGSIFAGEYFATSTNELIRFQVAGQALPVFISPSHHKEFLGYCRQHVKRIHRQTTLAGLAPQPEPGVGVNPT